MVPLSASDSERSAQALGVEGWRSSVQGLRYLEYNYFTFYAGDFVQTLVLTIPIRGAILYSMFFSRIRVIWQAAEPCFVDFVIKADLSQNFKRKKNKKKEKK